MIERDGAAVGFERVNTLHPWPKPAQAFRVIDGGQLVGLREESLGGRVDHPLPAAGGEQRPGPGRTSPPPVP